MSKEQFEVEEMTFTNVGKVSRNATGYYKYDQLMAVKYNPSAHLEADKINDAETQYFCVKGLWEPDHYTNPVEHRNVLSMVRGLDSKGRFWEPEIDYDHRTGENFISGMLYKELGMEGRHYVRGAQTPFEAEKLFDG